MVQMHKNPDCVNERRKMETNVAHLNSLVSQTLSNATKIPSEPQQKNAKNRKEKCINKEWIDLLLLPLTIVGKQITGPPQSDNIRVEKYIRVKEDLQLAEPQTVETFGKKEASPNGINFGGLSSNMEIWADMEIYLGVHAYRRGPFSWQLGLAFLDSILASLWAM